MRVTCPSCEATYNLDERRIPPGGAKLKCTKCQTVFPIEGSGGSGAAPPPLPGAAAPSGRKPSDAVPLPGLGGPPPAASTGSRAMAVPSASMTTGVIPLPSLGLGGSELPRLTSPTPESHAQSLSMTTGVIPLPAIPPPPELTAPSSAGAPRTNSDRTTVFPLPPASASPLAAVVRVPLPRPSAPTGAPPILSAPLPPPPPPPPAAAAPAATPSASVLAPPPLPLPPPSAPPPLTAAEPFSDAFAEPFPELDESVATPAPAPTATQAGDEVFADAWGANAEPAPSSPSFGEVELEGGNANATEFPFPEDFEPAQPGGFAWDAPAFPPPSATAPPPTAPPSPRAPTRSGPTPAVDPLEFDPSAPHQEDLEADLTAPLPRGPEKEPEPEDGLEMLGFLEEASKDAKAAKGKRAKVGRFHIRRRSGKIFGPFDEGVIASMLGDGQLLGNEDVSTDQETWTPLGSVPGFAQVMQRILARPDAPAAAPGSPPTVTETAPADLDRLRQVYEGRMAVVSSMVDSDVHRSRRRRLIQLAAVGGAVLLVLGAGASLGFSRLGPFGLRWLFPPHVRSGSPEAARLAAARDGMAEDTYASLKAARLQLEGLLAGAEIPEVRAAWVQAVSRLERQYTTPSAGDTVRINAALEGSLSLLGKHSPERVKAAASAALTAHQPDQTLVELGLAKSSDTDMVLLRAEALLLKNQSKAAVELLEPLSRTAPSARVFHALGLARLAAGDISGADTAFTQALSLDKKHLSSALERASLTLVQKKDSAAALSLLAPLVEPGTLATLSPAEQARALTLDGMALLAQGDTDGGLAALERAVKSEGGGSAAARGALARGYLAKHDLEKALPLLADAVQKDPQNAALAEAYVTALLVLGRPQDAQTAVAAALARLPGDPPLLLLSGRVNESLDRLSEAEAKYTAALAADPNNPEPSLALGRFFLRFRRNTEARAQFDALAKRLPNDPRVLVGLGDLAMADGDVAKARADFETASTADPKFAAAWLGQSRVAFEQGRFVDARVDADRALSLDANVPDGRLQHGLALWKLKDLAGAQKEMEAARTSSGNLKVNVAMGAVLLDQGDLSGAESLLNQALRVEPSNPEANFYSALVHAGREEWTAAIESMRAALDRVPGRASYHFEMGRIYYGARKVPEAIEEWKTAVKLDPKYAEAWASIGRAQQEGQHCEEAIAAYESALQADPTRSALLVAVGDCYAQTNHWADAETRYQAALRADSKLPGLYYRIARAYTEQGDQARAIPFYQKATVADPQNALAYYHLGYAYKERGKKREAIAAFKSFLQKSPNAKERQEVEDEVLDLQGAH